MDRELTLHALPAGVALTCQALSPKQGGGWHTMWWRGQDPAHPACAFWSGDSSAAAVYPTEVAAVAAFAELGRTEYRLPAPQMLLGTDTTPDRLAWISEAGETAAAEQQARYRETACALRPAPEPGRG